ncbi:MAG: tRNA (adenosine(37)-N6)-threonylcarbamoyltransferase complex ATPase subunit type 1 TsaE [Vicingaceae bacterium]|nr:tRNA (adenosine(37)-N6)-threonylcarbamoyltransferase complex ATPase subunit type 1 TsaE [Vicingaceae bacterium]
MKQYKSNSLDDLNEIAKKLISDFSDKKVILFYGEMGAGKTTLIKILCQELGIEELTNSPTFSIVNEYLSNKNETIYHFDFYRIEVEEEVFDMGYEDYFYGDSYCFIEWPEMIPNLLPPNSVKVTIELDADNNRIISVAH